MSSISTKKKNKARNKAASFLIIAGVVFILTSFFIFILTFYPVLLVEFKYQIKKPEKKEKVIKPVDEDFGIIIPKIEANAKVIASVNPYDEKEYQWQLTKGVAHAKGTAYPGQPDNVFIFSHSSVDFYEANRYNAIFYLLSKLEKDDEIYLFYKKQKFKYLVSEKKIVEPEAVEYLSKSDLRKTVTLMTCWPPGTTLKRLIIIGEISE